MLKLLKSTEGANDPKNLCHVVRALVRSRLMYGHEAFFAAHKKTLAKLQTAECKFLRYALGMTNSVPQEVVYREIGWLPLLNEIRLRTCQYVYRASAVDNSTDEELDIHFDDMNCPVQQRNLMKTPRVNSRMLSVANFIEPIASKTGIFRSDVVKIPLNPIPPWESCDLNIKTSLSADLNKQDHLPLLSSLAKEIIDTEYRNATKVYTDGSKLENGQVCCAFYLPCLNISKRFRLNNEISIFSAEMFAIMKALSFCNETPERFSSIVILTDSKSSLEALYSKSKNRRDISTEIEQLLYELQQNGCSVSFQWIPSHCYIAGNDIVDQAAKDAANQPFITDNIKYTVSEIACKLKKNMQAEWKEQYCKLASDRNWIVQDIDQEGVCPDMPRHHLQILYRLRGKTYLTQYTRQLCLCNEPLSFDHIFVCQDLIPNMRTVNGISIKHHIPLSKRSLLTKHPTIGWELVKAFIMELCQTDIGHLV